MALTGMNANFPLRHNPQPVVHRISKQQPEAESEDSFGQFARVDNGFLAWTFNLHDARGEEFARISRAFRGFGREVGLTYIEKVP